MKRIFIFLRDVAKKKRAQFIVKAFLSVTLFIWVILRVDWKTALLYLSEIRISFLLLYVVLLVLGIALSAKKWMIITRYKHFRKSYRWHFQTYLAGTFVNNFLPSTIGGDAYRALELGANTEGRRSPGVSTIFFDRLTGLWALAFLGVLFSFLAFGEMIQHSLWSVIVLGMGVFLVVDVVLTLDKREYFVRMANPFSEPIRNLVREISGFRDKNVIHKTLALGTIFNLVGVGMANYVLFHALGLSLGILEFLSVIFVINAISALPVSVNNIGIKEWAYFVFFGYLGVSGDVAVIVAIVSRFIQMLLSFFALPGYLEGRRR